MIIKQENAYILNTRHTSYVFQILETGHLEHLHYGKKVHLDTTAMMNKSVFAPGCSINYSQEHSEINLESLCLEMSTLGKGDLRHPFVELEFEDGNRTCDFIFDHDAIDHDKQELETLPSSYSEEEISHLCVVLKERWNDVYLELHYYTFDTCDVIVKQVKLINKTQENIMCRRLMSNQLDFQDDDYVFTTFTGGWAREMKKNRIPIHNGIIENGSISGSSSNHANPFVMLSNAKTSETQGSCYGMNLVYSGNHIETIERNPFQKVRFLQGIHPINFAYTLIPNDIFEAPEAVMSYSCSGFNGLSHQFHDFINNHIVRGQWKKKERPILINSWEAAYFDINEDTLYSLAKSAKDAGIELFVMDDGWFGNRNDDTSSLGDWEVNRAKFPNGLESLSSKIHDLGLSFGIWVEPEMVNVDSNLYREHPRWTLAHPHRDHSEGRNQRILDLCNPEVQNYIIETMSSVFRSSNCDYVKWDMNRMMSDMYSPYLKAFQQGEVGHRYMMGFYKIMKVLTNVFPNILFEGCASGGNRFDLGILCYYPQIWVSDNTDALVRTEIQNNASYGYPLSVMGSHVSDVPNHQTLRITDLNTRFNVACFGVLGYEFNLLKLNKEQLEDIKKQISFYKKWRKDIQYGDFYRIRSFENGYGTTIEASRTNITEWNIVNKEKEKVLSFIFQKLVVPNTTFEKVSPQGLDDNTLYRFQNENIKCKVGDSIHVNTMYTETIDVKVHGDTLKNHGMVLKQGFSGQGNNEKIRYFQDFASRIYIMEKVKE